MAALAVLLCGGCIAGGTVVVHGDATAPDNRVMRQVMRQDLWAQQALDSRPNPRQLDRIRSGQDQGSMDRARKELVKLIQAIDRGTWIRDTLSEQMRQDNDPRLAQEFDRAGRLRADAVRAAGDLAQALIEGNAGLSAADLRPGQDAVRKAQASEDRIARTPVGPSYPRLAAAPLPAASALDEAVARLSGGNAPAVATQAPSYQPSPNPQASARPEINNSTVDQQGGELAPPQQPGDSGGQADAAAPQNTLTIANDALDIITRKRPRSISLREDGLFDLSCADGEYLVAPDGKLVRKDPPNP
jgi:hypothetical protein